jgi:hypothetical protein
LEGAELPDLEAARQEAIQGARDIIADRIRAGRQIDAVEFEIADADGTVVVNVPFNAALVEAGST